MKLRIKFSKHGPLKFIGHLDIMRYFQKAMRRADIDIKYSEGYSPHQVMSFAAPLGLGLSSNGEYMDIEVNSMESCGEIMDRLNAVMADGIRILECRRLSDHAKNAMSSMAAADYMVWFREGKEPEDLDRFFQGFESFLAQEEIRIVKKTKKGERETDIKPGILNMQAERDGIFLKLTAGSADNLKPELVMAAYYQFLGIPLGEFTFLVEREEVYGVRESGEGTELLPLGLLGEESE